MYKGNCIFAFYLICILDIYAFLSQNPQDPYIVLGVKRNAPMVEVKRAYKQLVREWHPDKNKNPGASDKFMAVTQAYELLSDPVRKERFDRYGAYDTQNSHFDHDMHHGFDDIHNYAFGGGFGESSGSSSFFDKYRITFRMYANSILEKSYTQPFIIYAYSTYCHICYVLEPIWKNAVTDLETLGYGIATVNYITDGNLFEKLRISYLPAICILVEGRVIHYRNSMNDISPKAIRMFARNYIPSSFLVKLINYDSLKRFLDLWKKTNKPSILILGSKKDPRLRYLLLAMKFSHFARFAYINAKSDDHEVLEIKTALGIKCSDCENIFIFKEKPELGPVAKLTVEKRQFTTEEMLSLVNKHKLLHLSRISSTQIFDEFCPTSSRSLKHICVILPVVSNTDEDVFLSRLREFVEIYGEQLEKDRIHVATIFVDQQRDFMAEFKESLPSSVDKRSILVLWRYEYVKSKYTWLLNILPAEGNENFETLKNQLYLLLRGSLRMDSVSKINTLVDEFAPSWFIRFSRRTVRLVETIWFHLTKEELLPILSVAGTLFLIFFFGYGLNYLVNDNQTTKSQQFKKEKSSDYSSSKNNVKEWHPDDPKTSIGVKSKSSASKPLREMEMMIHELKNETYFGLIRLLKPGCRSIVILVDNDSKDTLMPKFARCVYSIKNNKTFSFAYLMVDKNLAFFRALLEHTLPDFCVTNNEIDGEKNSQKNTLLTRARLDEINPKQTLGTILVLCGWKLYFSIYHPMHDGLHNIDANSILYDSNRSLDSDCNATTDMKKESMIKKNVNLDNVLYGFPSFLDRMLEGSTKRYYIPEWPDNLK